MFYKQLKRKTSQQFLTADGSAAVSQHILYLHHPQVGLRLDEILGEIRLMCFTQSNGNTCKSQLYLVNIVMILLLVCDQPSWKHG